MITGNADKSGNNAVAATKASGYDPVFEHGVKFQTNEVRRGLVVFTDDSGNEVKFNQGKEITFFTTDLSVLNTANNQWDHIIPLSRFSRRTVVRMVNPIKTEDEKKKAYDRGSSAADIAHIEVWDEVSAPWFPGMGIFQVIRRDANGLYKTLCANGYDYPVGNLRDCWEQRLAAFVVGKSLVSDHHRHKTSDWVVYNRWAKNSKYSVYYNGLQFFRLSEPVEELAKANPLWTQLFEAGARWEEENNREFIDKYGAF